MQAITLMGMSGVGKTTLSCKLPRHKWFHYSADYRIATHYLGDTIGDFLKAEAMQSPLLAKLLKSDSIYLSSNVSIDNLALQTRKLVKQLRDNKKHVKRLQERLVVYRLQELLNLETKINGIRLVLGKLDDANQNTAKSAVAKVISQEKQLIVGIIGGKENKYIIGVQTQDLNFNLVPHIVNVAKKYGGRGGGKSSAVSAGGLIGNDESILEDLQLSISKLLE